MKQSLIISIITIFQLTLALVFQVVVLKIFGLDTNLDLFYASNTISLILVTIATSSLNYVLTPIFIKLLNENKIHRLKRLISSFINLSIIIFVIASLFLSIYNKEISLILFPGFKGEDNVLLAEMLALQSFISIFTVIVGILTAVNYSQNKLFRTVALPIVATLFQLLCVYITHDSLGILSIVLASAINQAFLLFGLGYGYFKSYQFTIRFDKVFIKSIKTIYPLMISSFFSKSDLFVNRYFASTLVAGAISSLHFGLLVVSLLSTFINKGISIVSLRYFSNNSGNSVATNNYFFTLCQTMLVITFYVVLNVILFLPFIFEIFLQDELISVAKISVLNNVILSLLGVFVGGVLSSVIVNPLYTKGFTAVVAKVSISLQVISLLCLIVFFKLFGFYALPIVMSIKSLTNSLLLLLLYNKYIFSFDFYRSFTFLIRVCVTFVCLFFISQWLLNYLHFVLVMVCVLFSYALCFRDVIKISN